ncbi:uncharacterized protein LOC123557775 [Mercenaria mercenaria]|uniref:uncharacterized protein LOC123557775 n=1 Tax=Mercenaria mercenaria TaxID=6596 RepID=UPI00234E63B7|nr:uncharacterized protein LOC123557775 [Mercenaria mercenaria]
MYTNNRSTVLTYSEFGGASGEADLTLILDDSRIPISKSVLCIASLVFKAMLKSGFKETDQKELKLPGKKSQNFVQFLYCIYPDKMDVVTEHSVHKILPLADEYRVQRLLCRCKEILLQVIKQHHRKGNVKEIYSNIAFAEKYNLTEMKKKLVYLASEYKLEDLNEQWKKRLFRKISKTKYKTFR